MASKKTTTLYDVHPCLEHVMELLGPADRAACRLVCRDWRAVHDGCPAFVRMVNVKNPDDLSGAQPYAARHAASITHLHIGGWLKDEPFPSYLMAGCRAQTLLEAILPHNLKELKLYTNGVVQELCPYFQQLTTLKVSSPPRGGRAWLQIASQLPALQRLQLVVDDDTTAYSTSALNLEIPEALLSRGLLRSLVLQNMTAGSVMLTCAISQLQQLTHLEVQRPAGIPNGLSALTSLQRLELMLPGDFHLAVHSGLVHLSNLQHLALEHCYFLEVPMPVMSMTRLTFLSLYGHSISNVEEQFFTALKNLRHLDLSSGPQQAFRHTCLQHLTNMPGLTALHLGACSQQLPTVPGWGTCLQDLQLPSTRSLAHSPMVEHQCYGRVSSLDLASNSLMELPQVLVGNNVIHRLRLANNRLCSIPIGLYLHSLQWLDLSGNCLTQLPQHLHMPRLKSLNLEANILKQLPQGSYLEHLTYLNLSHNFFVQVPEQLSAALLLRDLDLHHQVGDGTCFDIKGAELLTGHIKKLRRVTLYGSCFQHRKPCHVTREYRRAVRVLKAGGIVVD